MVGLITIFQTINNFSEKVYHNYNIILVYPTSLTKSLFRRVQPIIEAVTALYL